MKTDLVASSYPQQSEGSLCFQCGVVMPPVDYRSCPLQRETARRCDVLMNRRFGDFEIIELAAHTFHRVADGC